MGLLERIDRWMWEREPDEQRSLSWPWPVDTLSWLGNPYTFGPSTTMRGQQEKIAPGYAGVVDGALRSNAVVYACVAVRLRVFTEARFAFQRMRKGRPESLWADPSLAVLEAPWPGGTTGDLLARVLVSSDFAGNAFVFRDGDRLQVLRPDWVTIVSGLPRDDDTDGWSLGAEVLGYLYQPGGPSQGQDAIPLLANQVAHFAPMPDPLAPWRGMSWLSPILREIQGDSAATSHKLQFFSNAATPNMKVKADPNLSPERFKEWVDLFRAGHEGVANAYSTLFLGGGADADVIGANMRQMDFKQVQGAGETRIAAAAGVPPVLVGLSEGLQAATYSNYGQARRAFADEWARPTWRNFAGSLESIIPTPTDSRLWYDDRDIPFLQEDQADAATILATRAGTIKSLIDGGFEAASVVAAVDAGDLSQLQHTNLFSVQLQPPGTIGPDGTSPNGSSDEGTREGDSLSLEDLTLALQKIYLSVDVVITADEAREILNRYGAKLPPGAPIAPPPAPVVVAPVPPNGQEPDAVAPE